MTVQPYSLSSCCPDCAMRWPRAACRGCGSWSCTGIAVATSRNHLLNNIPTDVFLAFSFKNIRYSIKSLLAPPLTLTSHSPLMFLVELAAGRALTSQPSATPCAAPENAARARCTDLHHFRRGAGGSGGKQVRPHLLACAHYSLARTAWAVRANPSTLPLHTRVAAASPSHLVPSPTYCAWAGVSRTAAPVSPEAGCPRGA